MNLCKCFRKSKSKFRFWPIFDFELKRKRSRAKPEILQLELWLEPAWLGPIVFGMYFTPMWYERMGYYNDDIIIISLYKTDERIVTAVMCLIYSYIFTFRVSYFLIPTPKSVFKCSLFQRKLRETNNFSFCNVKLLYRHCSLQFRGGSITTLENQDT